MNHDSCPGTERSHLNSRRLSRDVTSVVYSCTWWSCDSHMIIRLHIKTSHMKSALNVYDHMTSHTWWSCDSHMIIRLHMTSHMKSALNVYDHMTSHMKSALNVYDHMTSHMTTHS